MELALEPGDHLRTLEFGGRSRSYLVHVPSGCDLNRATPAVLVFHGGNSNAQQMVGLCGLDKTADAAGGGFLVVYPNGTGRTEKLLTWNAGSCCGYAMRQNVDDVGFTAALLDDLSRVARIDADRVYAAGISNGGMLAYRLASELSDRIAAIASVSGPMGTDRCSPERPVSVLHLHGTADDFAPYGGGRGKKSFAQSEFQSAEFSVAAWVKANGCPLEGRKTQLPDNARDGTTVTRTVWGPGKHGSEVALYTIHGGGHTWPGQVPPLRFLGPATRNISANAILWEFFQKHPRN